MKKGDIVFVQGKGIISKFIRYVDKGTFSHVCIAMSDGRVIEADVDTKVVIRPFDPSKYHIIETMDLCMSLKQRRDVVDSALGMLNAKYDYLQLLWYGIRKLFKIEGKNRLNNPKNLICSELVFIALKESGVLEDLGINTEDFRGIDLTPNELYDLVKYACKK